MYFMRDSMDHNASHTFAPNVFCRSCGSPLVQATDWQQEDESLWGVRLWCPECEFEQAAVLERPQLVYLSLAVEEGFARVLNALDQLRAMALASIEFDLVEKARTERIEPAGR
jgi:hypothetical protein